jgi:hypothetical protein
MIIIKHSLPCVILHTGLTKHQVQDFSNFEMRDFQKFELRDLEYSHKMGMACHTHALLLAPILSRGMDF